MRTYVILASLIVASLFVVRPAEASVWKDPSNLTKDYKAGNCTLVSTRAEANASRVYTLNPDFVVRSLNASYVEYWNRNAGCNELQFHVDHNTSRTRLRQWLGSVSVGWFKNIGTTHYRGKTVSTLRDEWFFIDTQGAHRIPDWLTSMSWGLLIEDRIELPAVLTAAFYDNVPIATPLNFSNGPYADEMHDIWKENETDYSILPTRLAEEMENMSNVNCDPDGCTPLFEACTYESPLPGIFPKEDLLDWRWMLYNPGCPLD